VVEIQRKVPDARGLRRCFDTAPPIRVRVGSWGFRLFWVPCWPSSGIELLVTWRTACRRTLFLDREDPVEAYAPAEGWPPDAVQSWEQGRRRPEGPARALLRVIQHDPDVVRRALAAEPVISSAPRGA
jgi:hypothetical protein